MATVSTYLNFARSTEEAFNFYRSVFGTDFQGQVMRFGDMPPAPGQPPVSEDDKEGGKVEMELAEQFWGDYYGSLKDRFGVQWMFNCSSKI